MTILTQANFRKTSALAITGVLLAACADPGAPRYQAGNGQSYTSTGTGNKAAIGTLAGAAGGAILGSNIGKGKGNIAAIALGTLLGAGLGHSVGASLDRADFAYYNQTSQRAMETGQNGQSLPWSNPQSGNSGSITPLNYYQSQNGAYCREYTQTISVGGRREEGYGVACRQPDGSWAVQN